MAAIGDNYYPKNNPKIAPEINQNTYFMSLGFFSISVSAVIEKKRMELFKKVVFGVNGDNNYNCNMWFNTTDLVMQTVIY